MMTLTLTSTLTSLLACSLALPGVFAGPEKGVLVLRIVERDAQGREAPLPCRVHLTGPDGKPLRVPGLPFFRDHVSCPGEVRAEVAPGRYAYAVERGPEYRRASGAVEVEAGKEAAAAVVLERWIDLAARGWRSGETHVHRPLEEVPLLMRAEDLHVAPVITVWNQRNLWSERALPRDLLVEPEPGRAFHVLACEDERQGGALLYLSLSEPLELRGDGPEHPSPVKHIDEALEPQSPDAWVDIEKPFWWDVPAWVATGKVRSIGIANNHMCRAGMYEDEAWGRPRDASRLPPPRGNGFYSQEIYYRLLDCGFRIPPSAGSASGVLPNPVGYNRAYVRIDGPFSYAAWWRGLAEGRSFVTNGPVLLVEANGKPPGEVFRSEAGPVRVVLDVLADGNDPIEAVEVVRDGEVVERIEGEAGGPGPRGWLRPRDLRFERSGWFLVRAIARVPETFRFASTAPSWVEVGKEPRRVGRDDVDYFLRWIDERIARLEASPHLKDPRQREEVLRPHREARAAFRKLREPPGK
ncbi:MAG: CehA/McbA family metallohydrolase [Planctomycetes bacterium]|nr:CehA/McbA family metallohydrolase [Planctomycetota bacterium]